MNMKKKPNSMFPYIFLLFFIIACMVYLNLGTRKVNELNALPYHEYNNE